MKFILDNNIVSKEIESLDMAITKAHTIKLFNCQEIDVLENKNNVKYTKVLLFCEPSNLKKNLIEELKDINNSPRTKNSIDAFDYNTLIHFSNFNTKMSNLSADSNRLSAKYTYKFILCRIQLMKRINELNIKPKYKSIAYLILRTSHSFTDDEKSYLSMIWLH